MVEVALRRKAIAMVASRHRFEWVLLSSCLLSIACSSSSSDPTGGENTVGGKTSTSTSTVEKGGSSSGGATSAGGNLGTTSTAPTAGATSATTNASGGTSSPAAGGASKGGTASTTTQASRGGTSGASTTVVAGGKSAGGSYWGIAGANGAGATCNNGAKDEGETDVDCGGICAPLGRCETGGVCTTAKDCFSSSCIAGKCAAPLIVVKNAGCIDVGTTTCPASTTAMRARIQLINVGTENLDLKGYEIRYYFTDEAMAIGGPSAVTVDDKSITTFTATIEALKAPANEADHYISIRYSAGSIQPDVNRTCERMSPPDCADVSFQVHTSNYQGTYDPSNDYSFVPSSALINNGNVTVYRDGVLVWGTEP